MVLRKPMFDNSMFQKPLKDACMIRFILLFIKCFQDISAVFVIITLYILLAMIEKRKILSNKKQFCAAILTDLSQAFDCMRCDLLIAKLNAYGFDQEALKPIHGYLSDRLQKVKKCSSSSNELDILCDVLQGSMFGPLLFNIYIYIYDLFSLI